MSVCITLSHITFVNTNRAYFYGKITTNNNTLIGTKGPYMTIYTLLIVKIIDVAINIITILIMTYYKLPSSAFGNDGTITTFPTVLRFITI